MDSKANALESSGGIPRVGPAAWAAVGRALAVALVRSTVFGRDGAVVLLAREINQQIIKGDLKVAEAMLRDLSERHRALFEEFVRKYQEDLPEEFRREFGI